MLTTVAWERPVVQQTAVRWRLVGAAISAVIALMFSVLGSVVSVVAFLVAVPFAVTAVVLWRQASTRLNGANQRRRSTGHGGRDDHRQRRRHDDRYGRHQQTTNGQIQSPPTHVSAAEARSILDVSSDADQAAVRDAYRRRIKEVHPDQGGEEEEFRRVTAAYERLRERDSEGGV